MMIWLACLTRDTLGVADLYVGLGGVTATPIQDGAENTVHPSLQDGVWEERHPKQVWTRWSPPTDDQRWTDLFEGQWHYDRTKQTCVHLARGTIIIVVQ